MKKESKASKISGGFQDDSFDIEKLAMVANQISSPSPILSGSATVPTVVSPVVQTVAVEVPASTDETLKKDRRFTIILPHDLYMAMVMKTKSEGTSFTKYIHKLMESDLM